MQSSFHDTITLVCHNLPFSFRFKSIVEDPDEDVFLNRIRYLSLNIDENVLMPGTPLDTSLHISGKFPSSTHHTPPASSFAEVPLLLTLEHCGFEASRNKEQLDALSHL